MRSNESSTSMSDPNPTTYRVSVADGPAQFLVVYNAGSGQADHATQSINSCNFHSPAEVKSYLLNSRTKFELCDRFYMHGEEQSSARTYDSIVDDIIRKIEQVLRSKA